MTPVFARMTLLVAFCVSSASSHQTVLDEGGALREKVSQCLQAESLRGASVSVLVHSLADGRELFKRNPDQEMIPASNTKLVTSASALMWLGPDWSFETRAVSSADLLENGVLDGDLVFVGGGDPLTPEPEMGLLPLEGLEAMVQQLVDEGLREVTGDLLFDDSCFDAERVGPGWPQDQLDRVYCAPVSGLSFGGNCFFVECDPSRSPADIRIWPEGCHLLSRSRVELVPKKGVNQIAIGRPSNGGEVLVSGRVTRGGPSSRFGAPVRNPSLFVSSVFAHLLKKAGVRVKGKLRPGVAPKVAKLLAVHRSPLVPSLQILNKDSDNAIAEHLFKAMGKTRFGLGSFENGSKAVAHALRSLEIPGNPRFVDGSGLSRENQISARGMVTLLTWMYQSPYRDPFLKSLAISGVDGTLRSRMGGEMERRVRGKTGYLSRVSSLSGYIRTRGDDTLVFSILINGFKTGNHQMKRVQDEVCRVLASSESLILK